MKGDRAPANAMIQIANPDLDMQMQGPVAITQADSEGKFRYRGSRSPPPCRVQGGRRAHHCLSVCACTRHPHGHYGMVGYGCGAMAGVLIKNAESLEILEKIDTLVVDKTGTVTEGTARLASIVALTGRADAELLRLAASLERGRRAP